MNLPEARPELRQIEPHKSAIKTEGEKTEGERAIALSPLQLLKSINSFVPKPPNYLCKLFMQEDR
ncbi:MAG: hypothetical protein HY785_08980 [Oscillatoriophycideae cyanobacterium NC_groundwater_1537_Pr4_S-0.65um_50_18]|nr:hypothetical protein [Oscillatoriophycideae cyanobacterium NC_groundwater_1537_Pr4_S-0.65um_50_18]